MDHPFNLNGFFFVGGGGRKKIDGEKNSVADMDRKNIF